VLDVVSNVNALQSNLWALQSSFWHVVEQYWADLHFEQPLAEAALQTQQRVDMACERQNKCTSHFATLTLLPVIVEEQEMGD
jgi:hypothetical protein